MIVIICEPDDDCGLWLFTQMSNRGINVELVLPEELLIGSRISLHIQQNHSQATVELADGRQFDSLQLRCVINRMTRFPRVFVNHEADLDVIYAAEEARAMTFAWLSSLPCIVLNRPTEYSPHGLQLPDAIWRYRAAIAGINAKPLNVGTENHNHTSPMFTTLVIGENVISLAGSIPDEIFSASIVLSNAWRFDLLEIEFDFVAEEWKFLRANSMPDLLTYGSRAVEALTALLEL